ncbi:amidohydrolase family protein [Fluviibacterium sp. DFM31]|uniref:Amidohydrolase family protein n=1 Tax=Meridianimarinicoccus marinus TaxID=3231483 RepID=A0ABV3L8R0_9RHOB
MTGAEAASIAQGVSDLLRGIALIDGHHHFWQIGRFPYRWLDASAPAARFGDKAGIAGDYLPPQYLADFAGLPLAGSVHVQANCGADPVEETRWLQDLTDRTGWPTAIVGQIDLSAPDARQSVDRHRAFAALRGLRTPVAWDKAGRWRVADRPHVLLDAGFRDAAAHMAEHDLCLEMVVAPEQLAELTEFAAAHPRLQIVVNHFATLEPSQPGNTDAWAAGIAGLTDCPNVSVKLSGLWTVDKAWDPQVLRPFVDHLLTSLGSARVLYGSNMPVEGVNCPVDQQFASLARVLGGRTRAELEDIFCATARRIYRLALAEPVQESDT